VCLAVTVRLVAWFADEVLGGVIKRKKDVETIPGVVKGHQ